MHTFRIQFSAIMERNIERILEQIVTSYNTIRL